MEHLQEAMDIIAHGGNARSKAMEAIKMAKEGKKELAAKLLMMAEEEVSRAHRVQTNLIQDETRGKKTELNLLIVHAQDHLMNAISVKDLASEIIDMYERIQLNSRKGDI